MTINTNRPIGILEVKLNTMLDPRQRFTSHGSVVTEITAGDEQIRDDKRKSLKIRLHERCSRYVQRSARVQ